MITKHLHTKFNTKIKIEFIFFEKAKLQKIEFQLMKKDITNFQYKMQMPHRFESIQRKYQEKYYFLGQHKIQDRKRITKKFYPYMA
jgi:hypothetical protein